MKTLFTLLLTHLIVFSAHAEIFRWVDENGKVHFGDKRSTQHKVERVEVKFNMENSASQDAVQGEGETAEDEVVAQRSGPRVVMYSTSWCGTCKKAKRYFKQQGIAFTEYDIEKNQQANQRFKANGGKGVPLIIVGRKRMVGFHEEGFEKLYNM